MFRQWVKEDEPASPEVIAKYKAAGFLDFSVGNQKEEDWYCLLPKVEGVAALGCI